jgi:hypothetical protein
MNRMASPSGLLRERPAVSWLTERSKEPVRSAGQVRRDRATTAQPISSGVRLRRSPVATRLPDLRPARLDCRTDKDYDVSEASSYFERIEAEDAWVDLAEDLYSGR